MTGTSMEHRLLDFLDDREDAVALLTLVRLEGSGYQRPGAKMMVSRSGTSIGVIAGGCLDSQLARAAFVAIDQNRPCRVTFDTRSEDPIFGHGGGCEGLLDVLIEPKPDRRVIASRIESSWARECAVTVTRIDAKALSFGRLPQIHIGDRVTHSFDGTGLEGLPPIAADRLQVAGVTTLAMDDTRAELFTDPVLLPIRLIVLGGREAVLPLVAIGRVLGWQIIVCPTSRWRADFPVGVTIEDGGLSGLLASTSFDQRTAVVAMTHDLVADRELVDRLRTEAVGYVGILGSHRRFAAVADVAGSGRLPSHFRGPAGLAIGASSPPEIALAIASEILQVIGCAGGEPMHASSSVSPLRVAVTPELTSGRSRADRSGDSRRWGIDSYGSFQAVSAVPILDADQECGPQRHRVELY